MQSSILFSRRRRRDFNPAIMQRDNNKSLFIVSSLLIMLSIICPTIAFTLFRNNEQSFGGTTSYNFWGIQKRQFRSPRGSSTNSVSSLQLIGGVGGGGGKVIIIVANDDDDENNEDNEEVEEEEEETDDPYLKAAASEFEDGNSTTDDSLSLSSAIQSTLSPLSSSSAVSSNSPKTTIDWGGALGTLRKRVDDVEQGISQKPSQALFRLVSAQSPNQLIGNFVKTANPSVVQAMSGAVDSLLGGLSNPATGIETIVKATGDKIGSLCFQLQMTGYMFRNAEYVIALKKIMQLEGSATLQDYKDAFQRIDSDNSGYIEISEVQTLLRSVYGKDNTVPDFEIESFIRFFDKNADGKISWEEFERGLGAVLVQRAQQRKTESSNNSKGNNLLNGSTDSTVDDEDEEDEDDDEYAYVSIEPEISGTIEIELEDGKTVEVDAKEYVQNLKDEARNLKEVLRKQQAQSGTQSRNGLLSNNNDIEFSSITAYIASRQGDVKSLTEGISPEIVETMKMLVDYVLEGGERGNNKNTPKEEMQLEIPGSALQQLALWQLILGYRLREYEAKGDYLRLLE